MTMRLNMTEAGLGGQAAIDGELTIHQVAALRDELSQACAQWPSIDIDLARVTEIDSAGLQWMLMTKRIPGLSVRFVNHSPTVIDWLDLSGLAQLIGDPLVVGARVTDPA